MTYYAPLADRAMLALSGADTSDFLQGIITKDMRHIPQQGAIFAALLSPQGRFLFDFFITRHEDRFLLETDKTRLPDLVKRLTMYCMRSKVQFEELPDMKIIAMWGNEPQKSNSGNAICYADPRLNELGWRILYRDQEPSTFTGMTEGNYTHHRISLGVPEGSKDLIADRSLLLEYGYDELHGVDFDKGCYVGQEVTARSKHRATLRKFIYQVQTSESLPPQGTLVMAGDREVGVMASSEGNSGLAHLRVEEVEKAGRQIPLLAGGKVLTAQLPRWCKTSFAQGILKP